jgi:hypothetical protein
LFTYQSIHKKCPPIQWQGQLLLRAEEYFPGELPGEEDCDGSGQERRNPSNSHSSIRMEDTLLARSFCLQPPAAGEALQLSYASFSDTNLLSVVWFGWQQPQQPQLLRNFMISQLNRSLVTEDKNSNCDKTHKLTL